MPRRRREPQRNRKRQDARARKSERYSAIGRAFEQEVAAILERLKEEELISDFVAHSPHSEEDHEGRDFTCMRRIGDETHARSFGVTISMRSWNASRIKHPDTPQFCFPVGTKPETIRKRVLALFED